MPVFPGLGLYFEFSPQNCLSSRRPLWTDTHPTNIISQWRDEWKSAPVVNCSLVDDSTIWQPGFGTPTHYWVLLNHFWNNQGHCAVCILSKEVGPCSNWHVPLWQTPNDVTYCQQLPTVQAGGAAVIALTEWLKTVNMLNSNSSIWQKGHLAWMTERASGLDDRKGIRPGWQEGHPACKNCSTYPLAFCCGTTGGKTERNSLTHIHLKDTFYCPFFQGNLSKVK